MIFWLTLLPAALALLDLEPPPPVPASPTSRDPIEGYVDVRLNHFDASNTDTFPMRYLYNNAFSNNHIVIFVGGEWAISPGWVQGGLAYELARNVGAGLFYTEHRYYGLTRPSEYTEVSDLRFLTADQALADLAQFIQYVKSDEFDNGRFRNGSVALVGCSYAGSMASWMRLAYPHLIDAVFSDSGPLQAQEDFPEYLDVVAEALREQGGEACVESVEFAMRQIEALLDTPGGPAQISEMFNTCTPLQANAPLDLATFYWFGITESFAYLVQYAVGDDIPNACAFLGNPSGSPLERLANWIRLQPYTQPCIESRYSVMVAAHTNTSYDAPQSVMRLWTYQTCVEFGWYQTTSSRQQPFLNTIPLEYFHQMCKDFFTDDFDEIRLRAGIERSNLLRAGLALVADRVVSVAGGHDPWAPLAAAPPHGRALAPVYVVPETSHCRAIYATTTFETDELHHVKLAVLEHMFEYITGYPSLIAGAPRTIASMIVAFGVVLALLST